MEIVLELVAVQPRLAEVDAGVVEQREPIGPKAVGDVREPSPEAQRPEPRHPAGDDPPPEGRVARSFRGEVARALHVVGSRRDRREEAGDVGGIVLVVPRHDDGDGETLPLQVREARADRRPDAEPPVMAEEGDGVAGRDRHGPVGRAVVDDDDVGRRLEVELGEEGGEPGLVVRGDDHPEAERPHRRPVTPRAARGPDCPPRSCAGEPPSSPRSRPRPSRPLRSSPRRGSPPRFRSRRHALLVWAQASSRLRSAIVRSSSPAGTGR